MLRKRLLQDVLPVTEHVLRDATVPATEVVRLDAEGLVSRLVKAAVWELAIRVV